MPEIRFIAYSDYLCPWCYNASLRLERLVRAFGGRVEVDYRSFLLRPHPAEKRDLERFRAYARSWMRPGSEEDGGSFQLWETDEPPPSHSVPAHQVAKAAALLGAEPFERMHRRLLRAYFTENRNISSPRRLRELWEELELPPDGFERYRDPEILERILAEHSEAIECGASGVPAVRLEGVEAVVTGAQPYEIYQRWAERALERAASANTSDAASAREDG
ncbi:MAG: DsbA family protein [Myxococcota bacterium]